MSVVVWVMYVGSDGCLGFMLLCVVMWVVLCVSGLC